MALEHQHLILRAEIDNPPTCRTFIEEWLRDVVEKVDMKILHGPFSIYSHMVGNRGMTAGVLIETSHIIGHWWDEEHPGTMQFDLYSCKCFDLNTVLSAIDVFKPQKLNYRIFDRDYSIIEQENNLTI